MAININQLSNVGTYRQSAPKADAHSSVQKEKAAVDEKPAVDAASSKDLVKKVEGLPHMVRRNLEFSIDRETGREIIRVIDSDTKEVIRQIPPEQILHIIEQIQELQEGMTPGVLLDDKV
jgi:flagellar protein FlaG